MSPWEYAQRYLPVEITGPAGAPVRIEIRRYRLGAPKAAKDQLLAAETDEAFDRAERRVRLLCGD